MKYDLLILPEYLEEKVLPIPHYHNEGCFASIVLKNGEAYTAHIDNEIYLTAVKALDYIPFSIDDIQDILPAKETIPFDQLRKRFDRINKRKLIDYDGVGQLAPASIPVEEE